MSSRLRAADRVPLLFLLLPFMLFLILGGSTRLMWDDLCIAATAREVGVLGGVAHYRNAQFGSYTDLFFLSLAGPGGIYTAAIFTVATLILWLLGLSWLLHGLWRHCFHERAPRLLAVNAAALAIAAALNALASLEALYWFNASSRYTFPIALWTLVLAACLQLPACTASKRRFVSFALLTALGAFFSAGASELFAVFQLTVLGLLLAALVILLEPARRRPYLALFSLHGLVTALSLLIQLTAPGAIDRMSRFAAHHGMASRELTVLLPQTAGATVAQITEPAVFGAFASLAAIALYALLSRHQPAGTRPHPPALQLKPQPLLMALAAQLLCLPLLWQHSSDAPQLLGRYSVSYASVLAINAGLLVLLLALLWLRARLNRFLIGKKLDAAKALALPLMLMVMLVAATQARSMHWRAAAYLVLTTHSLLLLMFWQLRHHFPKRRRRALTGALGASYGFVLMPAAAVIFINFYTTGNLAQRSLAFLPYMLTLQGILWGGALGYALQLSAAPRSLRLLRRPALLIALALTLGIVWNQSRHILPFRQYAQSWDARHISLQQARAAGARSAAVPPFTFDLESYISENSLRHDGCPLVYYDLQAISIQ